MPIREPPSPDDPNTPNHDWAPRGSLDAEGKLDRPPEPAQSETPKPPGPRAFAEVEHLELEARQAPSASAFDPPPFARRWLRIPLGLLAVGALIWVAARATGPLERMLHRRLGKTIPQMIYVDTDPTSAEVYCDSEDLGQTPLTFPNEYDVGTRLTLKLVRSGYFPAEVSVPGGKEVHLRQPLVRHP